MESPPLHRPLLRCVCHPPCGGNNRVQMLFTALYLLGLSTTLPLLSLTVPLT